MNYTEYDGVYECPRHEPPDIRKILDRIYEQLKY